jgi:2-polyprenyl-6-methoxyphenol hydroxylase-like FAD-dependent oxidoreductase
MSAIVVCGGGIVGLAAAMMLAADGHDVTVLESDPTPPPADPVDAWDGWERRGVAQFRQPHNLLPGAGQVLASELPGLNEQLAAAGCPWWDILANQPPGITDREPRPGDERFRSPTGRRPVVEAVFAAAAESAAGVTVRRGVDVTALLRGPDAAPGVPHVSGVRLNDGAELAADLVIDAMGRRSTTADWIADLAGRPPYVESQDCGFVYYTRYFTGPTPPQMIGPPVNPFGTISVLTIPGDNETWSLTIWAATGDAPLKELRHSDVFDRVIGACPAQAHWLDGKPITDVLPMAGVIDRYRRYWADEQPLVTGFVAVGDAWASTNPSGGRGISVGLVHAQALRQVVRAHLDNPAALAAAFDAATASKAEPYYRRQLAFDELRLAEMKALREGLAPPPPDPFLTKLEVASMQDPDVFRARVEMMTCLDVPANVLARPGLMERIEELGDGEPFRLPGPDRTQLLALLTG